jgi:hypothetical protein
MSTFTSLLKIRLNSKEIPQYISKIGIFNVDNLGDMCTRSIDCPIALLSKMASYSRLLNKGF